MKHKSIPSVSVNYAANGSSKKFNELGMRRIQERAYEKRGEQYLLIKSPPASGKSRALMFIALGKLADQGIGQTVVVVPEKMPDDLRAAHERNDEVLERVYIGRRFKNDTERLEKLFDLYTRMTTKAGAG